VPERQNAFITSMRRGTKRAASSSVIIVGLNASSG